MTNEKLFYRINYLLKERFDMENVEIPDEETEQFRLTSNTSEPKMNFSQN